MILLRRSRLLVSVLLLIVVSASVDEAYIEIDQTNYASVAAEVSPKPLLIEVYSTMCESCKEFAPRWDEFAHFVQKNTDNVAIGRICVDKAKGAKLASQFKGLLASGIPKVIFLADPVLRPKAYVTLQGGTSVSGLLTSLASLLDHPLDTLYSAPATAASSDL